MKPPVPSIADYLWLFAYGFLAYYLFSTYREFKTKLKFSKKALIISIIVSTIGKYGGSASGAGSKRRRLVGPAVCHCGAATEAGSGTCYLKFGSVLPRANAAIYFNKLLSACEIFAKAEGMSRLVVGVNTGRQT